MNNEMLMHELHFSRSILHRTLDGVSEEEALRMAPGFNNHILWNTGHLLFSAEQILFGGTGREMSLPERYKDLFARGSKPSEWTSPAPTLAELVTQLKDQETRIQDALTSQLDTALPQPREMPGLPPLHTVAEVFSLALYHESLHTGYIQAQKRAVRPL